LTNVIVTGFGVRCSLVREGKMFVEDEAKILSRVGCELAAFQLNGDCICGLITK